MKFRRGFISNSSSSSFIMIAEELKESELRTRGYELAHKKKLHAINYGDVLFQFPWDREIFMQTTYRDENDQNTHLDCLGQRRPCVSNK